MAPKRFWLRMMAVHPFSHHHWLCIAAHDGDKDKAKEDKSGWCDKSGGALPRGFPPWPRCRLCDPGGQYEHVAGNCRLLLDVLSLPLNRAEVRASALVKLPLNLQ